MRPVLGGAETLIGAAFDRRFFLFFAERRHERRPLRRAECPRRTRSPRSCKGLFRRQLGRWTAREAGDGDAAAATKKRAAPPRASRRRGRGGSVARPAARAGALVRADLSVALRVAPTPPVAPRAGVAPELLGIGVVDGEVVAVVAVGEAKTAMLLCTHLGETIALVGAELVSDGHVRDRARKRRRRTLRPGAGARAGPRRAGRAHPDGSRLAEPLQGELATRNPAVSWQHAHRATAAPLLPALSARPHPRPRWCGASTRRTRCGSRTNGRRRGRVKPRRRRSASPRTSRRRRAVADGTDQQAGRAARRRGRSS